MPGWPEKKGNAKCNMNKAKQKQPEIHKEQQKEGIWYCPKLRNYAERRRRQPHRTFI